MLIFGPRASRMAPREADAMPLPSEETTPPVTNTNRVMWSPPIPWSTRKKLRERKKAYGNNRNSTGVQVSRTRGLRQSTLEPISRLLDDNRPAPPTDGETRCARARAPARVQPQVGDGNQGLPGEYQRQRVAHPRQHAEGLTKVLHALGRGLRLRFESLAACSPAPHQMCRQALRVDAAELRHPAQFAHLRGKFHAWLFRREPAPRRRQARRARLRQEHSLTIAPQCVISPHDCRQVIGFRRENLPQGLDQARRGRRLDARLADRESVV